MLEPFTGLFTVLGPFEHLEHLDRTSIPGSDGQTAAMFLMGYSAAFAIALHNETGWPIYAVEQDDGRPAHVFCVKPDDDESCYADVRGVSGRLDTFLAGIIERPMEAYAVKQINDTEQLMDTESQLIGADTFGEAIVLAGRYIKAHPDYYGNG